MFIAMEPERLIKIYECLCDETRLRIVHLLQGGPLCVCHLQEILGISQVKASRHLGYLRDRGLVEVEKRENWRIYSLPAEPPEELRKHLACLADCVAENRVFAKDRAARTRLVKKGAGPICC